MYLLSFPHILRNYLFLTEVKLTICFSSFLFKCIVFGKRSLKFTHITDNKYLPLHAFGIRNNRSATIKVMASIAI